MYRRCVQNHPEEKELKCLDLQCCVSFRCAAEVFGYTDVRVNVFQLLFPDWLLQNTEYSFACSTVVQSLTRV